MDLGCINILLVLKIFFWRGFFRLYCYYSVYLLFCVVFSIKIIMGRIGLCIDDRECEGNLVR